MKSFCLKLVAAITISIPISAASIPIFLPQEREAIAQEVEGCFMVDSKGRTISLNGLCPNAQPSGATDVNGIISARIKRRAANTPVIDVIFNGNQTFEMIVDTGASGTLITQNMANALKITPVATVRVGIADGSQVRLPIGFVRSIAVGSAVASNVPVAIASRMEIGLLGHDFFGDYDIKIRQTVVEFHRR